MSILTSLLQPNDTMKFELKPYNQNATDEELLNDLKKVANQLKKDYISEKEFADCNKGRFSHSTIAKRFKGWNNALEKAGLRIKFVPNLTEEELLDDLKRVAKEIEPENLTQKKYNELGKYSAETIRRRLGWNKVLDSLGLNISVQNKITEKELFENLEKVWIKLGHQPGRREMVKSFSNYSSGPYINKYGSWRNALEAFVDYINSDKDKFDEVADSETEINEINNVEESYIHKTKRDPNDRIKLKVMWRDGNICKLCCKHPLK